MAALSQQGRWRAVLGCCGMAVLCGFIVLLADFGAEAARKMASDAAMGATRGDAARLVVTVHLGVFFAIISALSFMGSRSVFGRWSAVWGRHGLSLKGLEGRDLAVWVIGSLFLTYVASQCFHLLDLGDLLVHPAIDTVLARPADRIWSVLLACVVVSVGPALGEEVLFRGLLLRGLLRYVRPIWCLGLVTVAFSAFHPRAGYAAAVLPVSLWWTIVALRSGSLWPVAGGHLLNNTVSVLIVSSFGIHTSNLPAWVHALAWVLAFPAFVLGTIALVRE